MPLFVVRVTEVNEALQHMQRVVDAVALTELARTAHVVEFGIFQQDADVVQQVHKSGKQILYKDTFPETKNGRSLALIC